MKNVFRIITICGLSVSFFYASCKHATEEQQITSDVVSNPATAGAKPDNSELPVFSPDSESHDFGIINQGDKVTWTVNFRNTGKSDLLLADVSASCGCTVPGYSKKPVPAGEKGSFTVTFDSEGKEGIISKTVTVTSNTIPNTKVLTIKGNVIINHKK